MAEEEKALEKAPETKLISTQQLANREQFAHLMGLAKTYYSSGLYPDCKNAIQAFVKIQTGVDLGLKPTVAMRCVYIIPNARGSFTISLAADLMKALVKEAHPQDSHFAYDIGQDYCTLTAKRIDTGETFTTSWDRERLERTGIHLGKDGQVKANYARHMQEMLRHRCDGEACPALWPELVGGLVPPDALSEAESVDFVQQPSRTQQIEATLGVEAEEATEEEQAEKAAPVLGQPHNLNGLYPDISDEEIPTE